MQTSTKQNRNYKKEKKSRNRKEKLITKTKRAKQQREKITKCGSPSPRPIKKGTSEKSKQLVIGSI